MNYLNSLKIKLWLWNNKEIFLRNNVGLVYDLDNIRLVQELTSQNELMA